MTVIPRFCALNVTLALVASTVLGCGDDCQDIYVSPSYRISVFDKDTRTALCDAEVRVGDASARKSTTDCTYVFEIPAGDQAVISAKAPGYAPATVTVPTRYDKDSCGHAIAVDVEVELVTGS